jgi:hypothetical protein
MWTLPARVRTEDRETFNEFLSVIVIGEPGVGDHFAVGTRSWLVETAPVSCIGALAYCKARWCPHAGLSALGLGATTLHGPCGRAPPQKSHREA